MKINHACWLLLAVSLFSTRLPAQTNDLILHEWGTFTSFQADDGKLLSWAPLESSELPQFVHILDMRHLKVAWYTLQRLETPVDYFYSDHSQTVDVSVKFPSGHLTEWFPEANGAGTQAVDERNVAFIDWTNLQIMPTKANEALTQLMPTDTKGTHYFAARDTDSAFVRTSANSREVEKFLFYRGAGDFKTPLTVSKGGESNVFETIELSNTGSETLKHLFVVYVMRTNGPGLFIPISELKPGEKRLVCYDVCGQPRATMPRANTEFKANITAEMVKALESSGLYSREAEAMVKTWDDSWFSEGGLRVLYLLPQKWTDEVLPLTISPTPKETLRVMVGRAEVLTPARQRYLTDELEKASHGDSAGIENTRRTVQELGRFGAPALGHVFTESTLEQSERNRLWTLIFPPQASSRP